MLNRTRLRRLRVSVLVSCGDLASEIVEVGKDVTHFKVGDRVMGHAAGMDEKQNRSSEGAFQQYTVVRENLAASIPDALAYEQACVLH